MASEETILSWNFANWVTVAIIAVTLFVGLGLLQKYMQQKTASAPAPAAS